MLKVRDCVKRMTGYVPGEPAKSNRTIKLNQNENRYPPSHKVGEAIAEAAKSLALYPESTSRRVREAAATVYGVPPERVMVANGSDEMLRILFQSLCDPGDEVVAFYPSYTYYATLAAMHDVVFRQIDFTDDFLLPATLDFANARLVFLPNPNAPTGVLFPESELRRLLAAVPNGLVVVDEAYADFAGFTAIPLIEEYENLAVIRTFSKGYSLAGLRAGLGFAHKDLLAELEKVRDYYNLDRLAQAGAEAALLDHGWLAETTAKIVATRERSTAAIAKLGLRPYPSKANFLLVRCGSPAEAARVFQRLRDRDVLVRYFRSRRLDDCLRITVGTDADMDRLLEELRTILG